MATSPPILIAGGGLGGLTLALALARRGIDVHILERRRWFSEAGAGLQISPNGQRVLDALGVAGVLAPQAAVPSELRIRDGRSGRILKRLPLGDWLARRHGAPYWVAHRRDVQSALLACVARQSRIHIRMSFDVSSLQEDAAGVSARGSGGEVVQGRALIGADGVFSNVRRHLFPASEPGYSGRTAARAVFPTAAVKSALAADATELWLSPRAHVVSYPIRGGSEVAVIVVRTEPAVSTSDWSEPVDHGRLLGDLQRCFYSRLVSALSTEAEWRCWSLFEQKPLAAWSRGAITLLGDAAHPTLPFLAQGASLAFEDAWTLAARIETEANVSAAFRAYESERRQRTARAVATAQRNGRIFHLGGPSAALRNTFLRTVPGATLMAGLDWLYGWRPEPAALGTRRSKSSGL